MARFLSRLYYRGFRQYRILSKISGGGMSNVYRAESRTTGDTVAIKILLPKYTGKRTDIFRVSGERQVEGDISVSLSHPNVIRTYSYGEAKQGAYFVMEYIRGPNLKRAINTSPYLVRGRELLIINQAAAALKYLHFNGIIHRDICTKNMLITEDGDLKLIDFGLALTKSGRRRPTDERSGTPSYMAPEQIRALSSDEKTDIYGFGVVMYEIISGGLPSSGRDPFSKMMGNLAFPAVDLRKRVPGMDPGLSAVVSRAMNKNPDDRYPDMDALIRDLKPYSEYRIHKENGPVH